MKKIVILLIIFSIVSPALAFKEGIRCSVDQPDLHCGQTIFTDSSLKIWLRNDSLRSIDLSNGYLEMNEKRVDCIISYEVSEDNKVGILKADCQGLSEHDRGTNKNRFILHLPSMPLTVTVIQAMYCSSQDAKEYFGFTVLFSAIFYLPLSFLAFFGIRGKVKGWKRWVLFSLSIAILVCISVIAFHFLLTTISVSAPCNLFNIYL